MCGAGAGADADQAGELQSAPKPPKTRRLESGLCPWEPGLKCFGVRKWVRAGGWAGARTGRYQDAALISKAVQNLSLSCRTTFLPKKNRSLALVTTLSSALRSCQRPDPANALYFVLYLSKVFCTTKCITCRSLPRRRDVVVYLCEAVARYAGMPVSLYHCITVSSLCHCIKVVGTKLSSG